MTPEEFKERMQLIAINDDEEVRHFEADNLMCLVLEKAGYADGVELFKNMKKWYA